MKPYELLFIVPSQYTDEEIQKKQADIATLIEKAGAAIIKNQSLGKIRLAYPIQQVRHGTYILIYFDAEPSVIQQLNRQLTLAEGILRHTLIERNPGAEKRTFELTSYVAPLSEEARLQEEPRMPRPKPKVIAPTVPVVATEASMSIEEIDKKLDELLESDLSEKV